MRNKIKECMKYTLLLTFSGYVYVCLELLFRGRSDISMLFCSTVCAIPVIILNNYYSYDLDFGFQVIFCTLFATGVEWIVGLLVNQDHQIWDYRNMPMHSPDGQVCVPFMLLWSLIIIIVIPLMDYIDWQLFDYMPDTPPYYKLFGRKIFQFKARER